MSAEKSYKPVALPSTNSGNMMGELRRPPIPSMPEITQSSYPASFLPEDSASSSSSSPNQISRLESQAPPSLTGRSMAFRSMNDVMSFRSSKSCRSARTAAERINDTLRSYHLNEEEIELEVQEIVKARYAKMIRKNCPVIVKARSLLEERERKNLIGDLDREGMAWMTRPELREVNRRLGDELKEVEEELEVLTKSNRKLKRVRDRLKQMMNTFSGGADTKNGQV
jgi:hypothetical protein